MEWTHCPIDEVPEEVLAEKPPAPRKRTLATKKRDYERHLLRWGCHLDAAARAGVDPRTARRWREEDPAFADRCDVALSIYIDRVEEEVFYPRQPAQVPHDLVSRPADRPRAAAERPHADATAAPPAAKAGTGIVSSIPTMPAHGGHF